MAKSLEASASIAAEAPVPVEAGGTWRPPADAAGFASLMREHQSMVYSLAYHFLHNRAAAEDLTQDVFLRLYQSLKTIQSPSHLKHWLRQATCRRCIDAARRSRLRRFLTLGAVPEPAVDMNVADPVLERRMRALVAALPPKLRMTVVLRYQEDLEPTEIAAVLGVPLSTVKSSLRRSLARLRTSLTRQLQGTSL